MIGMKNKLENVEILVLDVDGTLTDGGIYIDNNGIETKKFSVKDGLGIKLAKQAGIEVIILTGRESICVKQRAMELGIKYVFQGVQDKVKFLKQFVIENNLNFQNIAYIGDDLNDLSTMQLVGFTACPGDAAKEIKDYVDYKLIQKGGCGAVREFIDLLLNETGKWREAVEKLYLKE